MRGDCLDYAAEQQWSTPSVADTTGTRAARGGDRSDELLMRGQAKQLSQWLTPRVATGDYTRDGGDADKEEPETFFARAAEVKAKHNNGNGMGTPTAIAAKSLSSLLAPETSRGGAPSSPERRSLNPRFVEWLMGWPLGWTNFDCSEMAWSRWQQHMRSALLALDLPADPRPQQMSLWG